MAIRAAEDKLVLRDRSSVVKDGLERHPSSSLTAQASKNSATPSSVNSGTFDNASSVRALACSLIPSTKNVSVNDECPDKSKCVNPAPTASIKSTSACSLNDVVEYPKSKYVNPVNPFITSTNSSSNFSTSLSLNSVSLGQCFWSAFMQSRSNRGEWVMRKPVRD